MFLLAWFVWLTCSMSGFPDVGYSTVAHYTLSGELYTFPACPLDRTCVAALPTLKRLQTRVRPNFYCLGLALCNHLHHDSMFYTHSLPQYASDWLGSLVLPTGRAFSFLLGLREVPYFTTWPWFSSFLAPNRGVSRPDPRFRPDPRGSHPPLGCFSSRRSVFSPGETPSETKPSAVLCCNRHISLGSFRHALHTKENFSTVHFGCTQWQKPDIVRLTSKAWILVNGLCIIVSSPQALQT